MADTKLEALRQAQTLHPDPSGSVTHCFSAGPFSLIRAIWSKSNMNCCGACASRGIRSRMPLRCLPSRVPFFTRPRPPGSGLGWPAYCLSPRVRVRGTN